MGCCRIAESIAECYNTVFFAVQLKCLPKPHHQHGDEQMMRGFSFVGELVL